MTADWGVPNHLCNSDSFVHHWVDTKEMAGMSKYVFNWLSIEWHPLRSVGLDSQHKADRSAVQCSCPKLLLGKHLLGMSPFPWGVSIHILEGSACQWCMDRPDQMWSIGVGTLASYYTSILAKTLLGLCAQCVIQVLQWDQHKSQDNKEIRLLSTKWASVETLPKQVGEHTRMLPPLCHLMEVSCMIQPRIWWRLACLPRHSLDSHSWVDCPLHAHHCLCVGGPP